MQKLKRSKIILILAIVLVMVLFLFPIKLTYKDGGTTTYNAVLYKVIIWNILDQNEPGGYRRGSEIHLFPNNFHDLEYYEEITFPDQERDQENESEHKNNSDEEGSIPFKIA